MKRIGWRLALLILLGAAASPMAWADHARNRGHHGHHGHHLGGYVGAGVYLGMPWPGYYHAYPPYYYPPYAYAPAVVVPPAPPVYIEKEPVVETPAPAYWYFCSSPEGYYPYVKECPAGWRKVAPQAQASPQ